MIGEQLSHDDFNVSMSANLADNVTHPEADITRQRLEAIFGGPGQMTPAVENAMLVAMI